MADVGLESDSDRMKVAVKDTLRESLSPIASIRNEAEIKLRAFEFIDDYGLFLAEFTIDKEVDFAIRQLSAVLLRKYVDVHWTRRNTTVFQEPEASDRTKEAIRQIIVHGLKEKSNKLRSCVAYAITAIALFDWPTCWSELFNILVEDLRDRDNECAVHGALEVLCEFCLDLTLLEVFSCAPTILEEVYRIFSDERKYNIRTRGKAIELFCVITPMIMASKQFYKGAAESILSSVLPKFAEVFTRTLRQPDGDYSDFGLRDDVIKALTLLVRKNRTQLLAVLPAVLPSVWQALTQAAEAYQLSVVHETFPEPELDVDAFACSVTFVDWVYDILEFIEVVCQIPCVRSLVEAALADLFYYIIMFSEVTEEQVTSWKSNPNNFVDDEEDESFACTVRTSAQHLVRVVSHQFAATSLTSLSAAMRRHFQEAEALKAAGNDKWWKSHEACIMTAGTVSNLIKFKADVTGFNMDSFFRIVLEDMQCRDPHGLLVGRCLWLGSRCITTPPLAGTLLDAVVIGLQPTQQPVVRILAVRAVLGFCHELKAPEGLALLAAVLPKYLDQLLAMAVHYSGQVLGLVLEAIAVVIALDSDLMARMEAKVAPLTIAVFLKYNSDPMIVNKVKGVFKILSKNPSCVRPLQTRLVPTLASILNAPHDRVNPGMYSVALEVLQTLVRSTSPPLSDLLMTCALPATFHCLFCNTDDSCIMQSGGECLRTFISMAPLQVCSYRDQDGKTGLQYVIQVASLLLNPTSSEHTATYAGRFLNTLITKSGRLLGDEVDQLLKAVLIKLQRVTSLDVKQSLIMVYAHLIHTQLDSLLNFLSGLPGPQGDSALYFVLAEWCWLQQHFYGRYETKVSVVALCRLLEYGISSNDQRLVAIVVRGDKVLAGGGGGDAPPNAQQQQDQWTRIPLLAKIFKVLLNELSNLKEVAQALVDENESDAGDDESNENIDGADDRTSDSQTNQEDTEDPDSDSDEVEEDEDLVAMEDPIYHIDLDKYLTEYFQSLSHQVYFPAFIEHLNNEEKKALVSCGVHM